MFGKTQELMWKTSDTSVHSGIKNPKPPCIPLANPWLPTSLSDPPQNKEKEFRFQSQKIWNVSQTRILPHPSCMDPAESAAFQSNYSLMYKTRLRPPLSL